MRELVEDAWSIVVPKFVASAYGASWPVGIYVVVLAAITFVSALLDDLGGFARELTWDGQLRWLGPEKGVIGMAVGALVNAAWDLRSRRDGKRRNHLAAQAWLTLERFRAK